MPLETQSTIDPAVTDAAIKIAADNLIRAAAAKNGMTFDDVPQEAKDDAYRFAAAAIAEDEAIKANPVYAQLQAEREAHELTRKQLAAVSQTRPNPNGQAVRTGPDPNVVRAQLGEVNWKMLTDNGRLQACGIDPATVTPVELLEAKKVFGRGMDSHYSSNLSKQDWARYQHLKKIAVVMGLQGQ